MEGLDERELLRLKSHYQLKYGVEMDDFALNTMMALEAGFESNRKDLERYFAKLEKDNRVCTGRHIYFTIPKVAFWYAAGRSMPWAIALVLLSVLLYSAGVYQLRMNKKEQELTKVEQKITKTDQALTKKRQKRPKRSKE